jgi:hypothetical protein
MSLSNPIKWVQGERISWPLMCLISYACGGLPFGFDRLPSVHRLNRKRINYSLFLCSQSLALEINLDILLFETSLIVYMYTYQTIMCYWTPWEKWDLKRRMAGRGIRKFRSQLFSANWIAFESLFDGCFARKTKCVWKSQSTESMHPFEGGKWIP